MRNIDNPSSANILPGDCIVATSAQRAALSLAPEDAGKVIVEKDSGRMYLATLTEGAKPLSANLAAELAAINSPVTLFQSGLPFVRFGGDGGSNGLLFTGTAGNFTLSSAVMSGLIFYNGYGYLPANSGGLGNTDGWYYFTMSSDTVGTFFNNLYTPSSTAPAIPTTPTNFANPSGGRLAQSGAELTFCSISLAPGALGNNGLIELRTKMLANTAGSSKILRMRANTGLLLQTFRTSTPNIDQLQWSQMAGTPTRQINTRKDLLVGETSATSNTDISTENLSGAVVLELTMQTFSTSDTIAIVVRNLSLMKA